MYFVYVLRSERTGRLYVGQTENVEDRVRRHNSGTQLSTKAHLPWQLVRVERFESRAEACRREREIKAKKSRAWIEWLISQPTEE